MEMTMAEWWGALGQVAAVTALSFVVLCLITSLVRFQLMTEKANEAEELGVGEQKDFRLSVMTRIGAARKAREPITVALLQLPPDGPDTAEIEARLKPALRADDVMMTCGDHLIGLLWMCGSEKAGALVQRLMNPEVVGDLHGLASWRVGVAGYPEHGFKTSALYSRALAMIDEAAKQNVTVSGMAEPEAVAEDKPAPGELADPVTGLIREEKMINVARRFIGRERKANRAVSMAYLEIDQFERVKDQFGASAADALLKELADYLGARFREKDMLARFGPEGFIIVLSSPPKAALLAVQRVLTAVRKCAFRTGPGAKLSLSAGVAGYPDVLGTAVHYFVAAELALKQAKLRGRNSVVLYDPAFQAQAETEKSVDHL
jgi:diguanylate cyclase (GGDEF)-like protein